MKNTALLSVLALATASAACATLSGATSMIQAPRFSDARNQRAQLSLSSADAPQSATLRMFAHVRNPNSTKLTLSKVKGSLFLEGQEAADVDLPLDLELKPRQEKVIPIDVSVRLDKDSSLARTLARSAEGPAVGYRVDGTMDVETSQGEPVFGPLTLLEGEVRVH
jgi:LEA14-like dessication related protein